jgi:small subunit ribosomal protein S2
MSEENEKNDAKEAKEDVTEDVDASATGLVVEEELLLPRDTLLSAGIHIGTRMKTKDMSQFIYRVRPDGLFVLDVKKTDERIHVVAKFLSRFERSKIAVVSARLYGQTPVQKFCELIGATPIVGRFIPGMFSNPLYPNRVDASVVVVSDPKADAQAVKEAAAVGLPVVALCSTDNEFTGVDLVIPTNNKGRRALAIIFWLLARQVLRERGEIPPDQNIQLTVDDFEAKAAKEEEI